MLAILPPRALYDNDSLVLPLLITTQRYFLQARMYRRYPTFLFCGADCAMFCPDNILVWLKPLMYLAIDRGIHPRCSHLLFNARFIGPRIGPRPPGLRLLPSLGP